MKTKRNEPCPCGSGKKYKKCCIDKKAAGPLPWPTFPEEFAIGQLREESDRFAAFWIEERPKIGEVHWAIDDSLPDGIWGRSSRLSTGEAVIRLANIPALADQDYKVAHELEHLVIDSEGFPMTASRPEQEAISSAVNSMLHDPQVHERLEQYGYREDIVREYEDESKDSRRQLEDFSGPANRMQATHWTLNYAGNLIDWRQLNGTESAASAFQTWFSERYPDIARDAKELLIMVDRIGYETPEGMRNSLAEFLEKYHLRDLVIQSVRD